jgi:hypothetical protein
MKLKEDFEGSKQAHDSHVQKVLHWNSLRDVTGKARPKKVEGRSNVQPKLIRRQAEWRYSALSSPFLSSKKLFKISPMTFEDTASAEQNQILLNWQFRTKLNSVAFINQYVRTAVDEGSVIVRVGWNRVTRMIKKMVPVFQYRTMDMPEQEQVLQQALQQKEADPNGYLSLPEELRAAVDYFLETGMPVIADMVGEEEVDEEEVVANHPTVSIIDPSNFYVDPSCEGDLSKAKFVVISFETSKADLMKDGRYKNLNAVNWSGNTILGTPDHKTQTESNFNFNDDLRKRVIAYEYWGFYDVEGNESLKPIVATWIGDTMIRMEENPFPDEKVPFVVVPYLPVKRSLLGEPDAEVLEDNQAILGAVTRGMIDLLARSANSQQGVAKNFLDVVNKRRFERGLDYEFNPGAGDPRLAIYMHQYPEIPNSAVTMMTLQNQEAEALTGVKSFTGGLSGDAYGDVAAGIRGMLDAASKREMDILQRLAQGVVEIGTKIVAMNAVFLSEEEVIRVTNSKFITIRREDLKGNFDLEVDIATAEVDEARAQDLGFMLQTIGPDMDPVMRQMILAEIADLKRMPELAHKLENYQPQPDPHMEAIKKLELAKLEAEIDEIRARAEERRAAARKHSSDADIKDLDYVEQETGTKHARDMDRVAGQAQANQDLEITKALTKPKKEGEAPGSVEAAVGWNALSAANNR